jgi:sulfatase maturation enzyme AslB (radical SAM superfamily)
MIGRDGWTVGDLSEGMKWEVFHQDVSVVNRSPCRTCWARYACGGTCYVKGVEADGNPLTVNPAECRFNSYVVGKNLELMAEIVSHSSALAGVREAFIRN